MTTANKALTITNALLLALSKYHPIVIEGMGGYDPRDPKTVASHITTRLKSHWQDQQQLVDQKPKLIVIQGDPLQERGISAITPLVAQTLQLPRGLVLLDEHIADYHARDADYNNVILQMTYTEMASVLLPEELQALEQKIDAMIADKNHKRSTVHDKPPLKEYFRHFALLQEVTKAACKKLCGEITISHTAQEISEFSVTSFYTAGLELGLVQPEDFVTYTETDSLDFDHLETIRYGTDHTS